MHANIIETWIHGCRILLAVSEPVTYRLVMLVINNARVEADTVSQANINEQVRA